MERRSIPLRHLRIYLLILVQKGENILSYYDRQKELAELGYEGLLLEGILGSTSEERRTMRPRSPNRDNKLLRKLHKRYKTNLSTLFSATELQENRSKSSKEEKIFLYSVKPNSFGNILQNLAEISSKYPSITNINLKLLGLNVFEGELSLKKIRSYLVFIHSTVDNLFWRTFLTEGLIGKMRSYRDQTGKVYADCETILELFSVPASLQIYLEDRFPDKRSLQQMKDWCYTNILRKLSISLVDNPQYIESKIRRKGYNDKGSLPKVQRTKPGYGADDWRYNFIYNSDLINKEGELVMNSSEQTLQDYLVELQTASTQRFLEYLTELHLKRRLFQQQTLQDIQNIVEDESLSSEQKVERILRNERTKIEKPPKYLGKCITEEGELREVYSDSPAEDRKLVQTGSRVSIQSRKTKGRREQAPSED